MVKTKLLSHSTLSDTSSAPLPSRLSRLLQPAVSPKTTPPTLGCFGVAKKHPQSVMLCLCLCVCVCCCVYVQILSPVFKIHRFTNLCVYLPYSYYITLSVCECFSKCTHTHTFYGHSKIQCFIDLDPVLTRSHQPPSPRRPTSTALIWSDSKT